MSNEKKLVIFGNRFRVVVNGVELGYAEQPQRQYPVWTKDGEMLGFVLAPEAAIPMLVKHYERNQGR